MLSKAAPSTIFWLFGMTRPGIETRSTGPLANTILIRSAVHNFVFLTTDYLEKFRKLYKTFNFCDTKKTKPLTLNQIGKFSNFHYSCY